MNPTRPRCAKRWYACKIKETANGGWRRAGGETRETLEVFAARCVAANGEVDDQETTARIRQDEAQEVADEETKETVSLRFRAQEAWARLVFQR